ncbi:MAG: ROK family protein [Firmicutes bacterium]|nr:ROK family protein [Bacillota bacterium]
MGGWNTLAGHILSVDIGATSTVMGIFDGDANLRHKLKFPTNKHSFRENVKEIKRRIAQCFGGSSPDQVICGMGLGLPVLYDEQTDIIQKAANLPQWVDQRVKLVLEAEMNNIPVCLLTDVYASLLGEKMFGAAKHASHFVNICVGTGLGMGMFLSGSLYGGANNLAGAIGHMTFREGGRPCGCGKSGCVETYVCGGYMEELLRKKCASGEYGSSRLCDAVQRGEVISSFEIIKGAHANDQLCIDILNEIGHNLGLVIADVILLLDPELVILNGGVIINSPPFLIDKIKKTVDANVFAGANTANILISTLGEEASLYGHYWAVRNHLAGSVSSGSAPPAIAQR